MSEENTEKVEEQEVVEYTDTEKEAMEKGWNPEGVEGKRNLSAEEFLDRQPFFDKIHKLERENRRNREQMQQMAEHHKKVAKMEYEKAISDLKKEKVKAYEEENFDQVVNIDDKIAEKREEVAKLDEPEGPSPDYQDWIVDNRWYETDPEMREVATGIGFGMKNAHPNMTEDQILHTVTERMKVMYPDRFTNTRRERPSPVESGTNRRGKAITAKFTAKDLTDDQRQVGNTFVQMGTFKDIQEYVDELVQLKELG